MGVSAVSAGAPKAKKGSPGAEPLGEFSIEEDTPPPPWTANGGRASPLGWSGTREPDRRLANDWLCSHRRWWRARSRFAGAFRAKVFVPPVSGIDGVRVGERLGPGTICPVEERLHQILLNPGEQLPLPRSE